MKRPREKKATEKDIEDAINYQYLILDAGNLCGVRHGVFPECGQNRNGVQ